EPGEALRHVDDVGRLQVERLARAAFEDVTEVEGEVADAVFAVAYDNDLFTVGLRQFKTAGFHDRLEGRHRTVGLDLAGTHDRASHQDRVGGGGDGHEDLTGNEFRRVQLHELPLEFDGFNASSLHFTDDRQGNFSVASDLQLRVEVAGGRERQ